MSCEKIVFRNSLDVIVFLLHFLRLCFPVLYQERAVGRRKGGVRRGMGGLGWRSGVIDKRLPLHTSLYSSLGRRTAPPAVCLCWPDVWLSRWLAAFFIFRHVSLE